MSSSKTIVPFGVLGQVTRSTCEKQQARQLGNLAWFAEVRCNGDEEEEDREKW